jgi:SAM-dependent methyltransferase
MIDIAAIATNLTKDETGIWVGRNQGDVSYPPGGNEACFAVEDTSFWFRHRNDVIAHPVRDLSPKDTLFDIGGGNGCVSNALQCAGVDRVLVEPGPHGARSALQRGVRKIIQSTPEDAGFAPGSLPSVGLFDVLEHIESDGNFLRTMHSYLRPNGRLYITAPAYNILWSADDVHAGHFRRYTTRSLSDRPKDSGFAITYCSYLFSFLVLPILLSRSIPSRIGFCKSVSPMTMKKEHSQRAGLSRMLVRACLGLELNRIKKRKRIPAGSSCMAVATKAA